MILVMDQGNHPSRSHSWEDEKRSDLSIMPFGFHSSSLDRVHARGNCRRISPWARLSCVSAYDAARLSSFRGGRGIGCLRNHKISSIAQSEAHIDAFQILLKKSVSILNAENSDPSHHFRRRDGSRSPKRDHEWLNNYWFSIIMRANHDCQYLFTQTHAFAIIYYIMKYISKAEMNTCSKLMIAAAVAKALPFCRLRF